MKKTRDSVKDCRKESVDALRTKKEFSFRYLVRGLAFHRLAGYFIAQTQQLGAKDNQCSRKFSFQDQLQIDGLLGTKQASQMFKIHGKRFQDSKIVMGCLLHDDKGVYIDQFSKDKFIQGHQRDNHYQKVVQILAGNAECDCKESIHPNKTNKSIITPFFHRDGLIC